jgi:hypothetical protein
LPVHTSLCGWRYLFRYLSTSLCTFGRRVACRSMKRSGTSSSSTGMGRTTSEKGLNTHRGVPRGECSCKPYSLSLRKLLSPSSYPLAYSVLLLPLSIVRWSAFDHKHVSSTAMLSVMSIYSLSGAVNVFLLVIVRPYLLLLTRPGFRVSVRAGPETEGTEALAGTSKTLGNPSIHPGMPRPLKARVLVLEPGPPPSFDSKSCEAIQMAYVGEANDT